MKLNVRTIQPKMSNSSRYSSLRDINMLWIGNSLSRIEQLSICSYLAAGHTVNLFTFGPVAHVPEHTRIVDALEYMTTEEYTQLRHYKTGSYSLAADLFRYRLLKNDAGFWSDSDFVCIRPVALYQDHVFGWQNESSIANGFLYLTADSPVLLELLDYFENRKIPPWLTPSRRCKLFLRKACRLPVDPANLPWGAFGPRALTWLTRVHGVAQQGQPIGRFYSHTLQNAERIFESSYQLDSLDDPETLLIHLWNERIRVMKDRVPEPDSLLARLFEQYNISITGVA